MIKFDKPIFLSTIIDKDIYLAGFCESSLLIQDYDGERKEHISEIKITLDNIREIINYIDIVRNAVRHNRTKYLEVVSFESLVFGTKIIPAIELEGFNNKTANLIYFQAWESGHSAGYCEVINYCLEYIEFAKNIIVANK